MKIRKPVKTPWAFNEKVAQAVAEKLAEHMKVAEDAADLSHKIGELCNGQKLIVAEMALGVVLAHIISEHPPGRRQEVFDRFCQQIISFGDPQE